MNNIESPIKICFLAGTLGKGGAEKQLYYILRFLKSKNFEIHVLTFKYGEFWQSKIEQLGIKVIIINSKNKISRILEIKRIIKNIKPQIFQSQHFYCNFYVGIVSKILNIESMGAIRNNFLQELSEHNKIIIKFIVFLINNFIANSYSAIGNYEKFIKKKNIFYLNNVYDFKHNIPEKIYSKPITLLNVGSLTKRKRQDIFIKLISELKNHDINAFLVGDGPEKENLLTLKDNLNIPANKLLFTGKINNVEDFYLKSDILIISSDFEGTPNVLLEAVNYGLGIIVSDSAGDASNLIKNNVNGFICSNRDIKTYLNAINKYTQNTDLIKLHSDISKDILLKNYSNEKMSHSLLKIYSEILRY
ncbi:MAG: glycosyltransferase [Ignavibacteria bacterium]|nr:glycosyltransferase [Ignavibacteria bacterium]